MLAADSSTAVHAAITVASTWIKWRSALPISPTSAPPISPAGSAAEAAGFATHRTPPTRPHAPSLAAGSSMATSTPISEPTCTFLRVTEISSILTSPK